MEKEALRQIFQHELDSLLRRAKACGFIITVETKPLIPLAMGNYELKGEVRDNSRPEPL